MIREVATAMTENAVSEVHHEACNHAFWFKGLRIKIRQLALVHMVLIDWQTDEKPNRRSNHFDDAIEEGYIVGDSSGAPYMIPNTSFNAAMVDLTNPAARKWLKGIMYNMVKTGVRGWMADFGESLPFDSCLFSGTKPFWEPCSLYMVTTGQKSL